ncbi:MAG: hypothetical protein EOP82_16420 [Variovorax sp.]|nr:MAG: hypothetical protein EOP82_16420 [Variovorax sp.]
MSAASKRQLSSPTTRLGAGAQHVFDWLDGRPLPVTVERKESVDVLRSLVAAGLVKAQIPEPTHKAGRTDQPPAVVTAITPAGRRWRAKLHKGVQS